MAETTITIESVAAKADAAHALATEAHALATQARADSAASLEVAASADATAKRTEAALQKIDADVVGLRSDIKAGFATQAEALAGLATKDAEQDKAIGAVQLSVSGKTTAALTGLAALATAVGTHLPQILEAAVKIFGH